ncbi:hypothetical protein CVIRNUC_008010 [Coccomyxa viridis]|uniref:ATP adenylyltransferase n=1 Tax=Coccomyxa viridis TaxID=1274662 RepID=A0AAV1IDM0_9CHLO|nr:hypothetical protein CVIRNUC_008010 [Coccomyxa viridis]
MIPPTAIQDSPGSFWQDIVGAYERALDAGAAYKTDTNTELYTDPQHGIEFVLRVAAALRDKPKPPKDSSQDSKQRNPFLPYEEALWVRHLSRTHTLLLNKFNVVAHHLICVTREFEQQTEPLNAADLEATWTAMQAFPKGALAYFNCGGEAGASQPHKHTQIVPLPLADSSSCAGSPFEGTVLEACQQAGAQEARAVPLRSLPYQCYAAVLGDSTSGAALAETFRELRAAFQGKVEDSKRVPYNVILTGKFMMVVPRSQESWGPVSVNSMGFAGSLFVRSQAELDYIKEEGAMTVLSMVGLPWS